MNYKKVDEGGGSGGSWNEGLIGMGCIEREMREWGEGCVSELCEGDGCDGFLVGDGKELNDLVCLS